MFDLTLKENFEKVLFHEYGHIIAGYFNNQYHGFTEMTRLKMKYDETDKGIKGFNADVDTNRTSQTAENINHIILSNISGCLFQSCYERKGNSARKFEHCYCLHNETLSFLDGSGELDKGFLINIIIHGRIDDKRRYCKVLAEYVSSNQDTYLATMFEPFYEKIEEKMELFWKMINENYAQAKSGEGYNYDYFTLIKPDISLVAKQKPEIEAYYNSFAKGLWPL